MKLLITPALLLFFVTSFSQWKKVRQLPSSDIFTLYRKDSILYAGAKNIIYFSRDKGQTWESTNIIPLFSSVNNIIFYRNELYAASFSTGVFKSSDGGATWQNISAGIFPEVSDFFEWRGDLYAATLGNSVFKLDPINRDNWLTFNSGLSGLSANVTSIAGNNSALIAGTLANGMYDYLPANSTTWEERFLLGQIRPTEGVYDIITAHDTLFLSGTTGRFYISTDNGLNWNTFANSLPSNNTSLLNAKQALLVSRSNFDGVTYNTSFYYIKKDAFQASFVNFSLAADNFTYKIEIFGDRLWYASNRGLFLMPLSDLPEITDANDTALHIALPVHFISFNAKCVANKTVITWTTQEEQSTDHFDIEKSIDGIQWTVIGSLRAGSSDHSEKSYSFTDNNPIQDSYYRIAAHDFDGKVQFTSVFRSSCNATDAFSVWPNPVHDVVFINITTDNESLAAIKVFDTKGALAMVQKVNVLAGRNSINVNMGSLANGIYLLSAEWNNGKMKKTVQIFKEY